jgi:hypothetical protein
MVLGNNKVGALLPVSVSVVTFNDFRSAIKVKPTKSVVGLEDVRSGTHGRTGPPRDHSKVQQQATEMRKLLEKLDVRNLTKPLQKTRMASETTQLGTTKDGSLVNVNISPEKIQVVSSARPLLDSPKTLPVKKQSEGIRRTFSKLVGYGQPVLMPKAELERIPGAMHVVPAFFEDTVRTRKGDQYKVVEGKLYRFDKAAQQYELYSKEPADADSPNVYNFAATLGNGGTYVVRNRKEIICLEAGNAKEKVKDIVNAEDGQQFDVNNPCETLMQPADVEIHGIAARGEPGELLILDQHGALHFVGGDEKHIKFEPAMPEGVKAVSISSHTKDGDTEVFIIGSDAHLYFVDKDFDTEDDLIDGKLPVTCVYDDPADARKLGDFREGYTLQDLRWEHGLEGKGTFLHALFRHDVSGDQVTAYYAKAPGKKAEAFQPGWTLTENVPAPNVRGLEKAWPTVPPEKVINVDGRGFKMALVDTVDKKGVLYTQRNGGHWEATTLSGLSDVKVNPVDGGRIFALRDSEQDGVKEVVYLDLRNRTQSIPIDVDPLADPATTDPAKNRKTDPKLDDVPPLHKIPDAIDAVAIKVVERQGLVDFAVLESDSGLVGDKTRYMYYATADNQLFMSSLMREKDEIVGVVNTRNEDVEFLKKRKDESLETFHERIKGHRPVAIGLPEGCGKIRKLEINHSGDLYLLAETEDGKPQLFRRFEVDRKPLLEQEIPGNFEWEAVDLHEHLHPTCKLIDIRTESHGIVVWDVEHQLPLDLKHIGEPQDVEPKTVSFPYRYDEGLGIRPLNDVKDPVVAIKEASELEFHWMKNMPLMTARVSGFMHTSTSSFHNTSSLSRWEGYWSEIAAIKNVPELMGEYWEHKFFGWDDLRKGLTGDPVLSGNRIIAKMLQGAFKNLDSGKAATDSKSKKLLEEAGLYKDVVNCADYFLTTVKPQVEAEVEAEVDADVVIEPVQTPPSETDADKKAPTSVVKELLDMKERIEASDLGDDDKKRAMALLKRIQARYDASLINISNRIEFIERRSEFTDATFAENPKFRMKETKSAKEGKDLVRDLHTWFKQFNEMETSAAAGAGKDATIGNIATDKNGQSLTERIMQHFGSMCTEKVQLNAKIKDGKAVDRKIRDSRLYLHYPETNPVRNRNLDDPHVLDTSLILLNIQTMQALGELLRETDIDGPEGIAQLDQLDEKFAGLEKKYDANKVTRYAACGASNFKDVESMCDIVLTFSKILNDWTHPLCKLLAISHGVPTPDMLKKELIKTLKTVCEDVAGRYVAPVNNMLMRYGVTKAEEVAPLLEKLKNPHASGHADLMKQLEEECTQCLRVARSEIIAGLKPKENYVTERAYGMAVGGAYIWNNAAVYLFPYLAMHRAYVDFVEPLTGDKDVEHRMTCFVSEKHKAIALEMALGIGMTPELAEGLFAEPGRFALWLEMINEWVSSNGMMTIVPGKNIHTVTNALFDAAKTGSIEPYLNNVIEREHFEYNAYGYDLNMHLVARLGTAIYEENAGGYFANFRMAIPQAKMGVRWSREKYKLYGATLYGQLQPGVEMHEGYRTYLSMMKGWPLRSWFNVPPGATEMNQFALDAGHMDQWSTIGWINSDRVKAELRCVTPEATGDDVWGQQLADLQIKLGERGFKGEGENRKRIYEFDERIVETIGKLKARLNDLTDPKKTPAPSGKTKAEPNRETEKLKLTLEHLACLENLKPPKTVDDVMLTWANDKKTFAAKLGALKYVVNYWQSDKTFLKDWDEKRRQALQEHFPGSEPIAIATLLDEVDDAITARRMTQNHALGNIPLVFGDIYEYRFTNAERLDRPSTALRIKQSVTGKKIEPTDNPMAYLRALADKNPELKRTLKAAKNAHPSRIKAKCHIRPEQKLVLSLMQITGKSQEEIEKALENNDKLVIEAMLDEFERADNKEKTNKKASDKTVNNFLRDTKNLRLTSLTVLKGEESASSMAASIVVSPSAGSANTLELVWGNIYFHYDQPIDGPEKTKAGIDQRLPSRIELTDNFIGATSDTRALKKAFEIDPGKQSKVSDWERKFEKKLTTEVPTRYLKISAKPDDGNVAPGSNLNADTINDELVLIEPKTNTSDLIEKMSVTKSGSSDVIETDDSCTYGGKKFKWTGTAKGLTHGVVKFVKVSSADEVIHDAADNYHHGYLVDMGFGAVEPAYKLPHADEYYLPNQMGDECVRHAVNAAFHDDFLVSQRQLVKYYHDNKRPAHVPEENWKWENAQRLAVERKGLNVLVDYVNETYPETKLKWGQFTQGVIEEESLAKHFGDNVRDAEAVVINYQPKDISASRHAVTLRMEETEADGKIFFLLDSRNSQRFRLDDAANMEQAVRKFIFDEAGEGTFDYAVKAKPGEQGGFSAPE